MWSTQSPPDVIEGTSPFRDIEKAFDVEIDEEDASILCDMFLDAAAGKIVQMRNGKK
ncbi:MAG: hypothetical protein HKL90_14350 [Elusimicrobia bacterium]|nr:hypothetical protein [Elusimicrobiota bacterium]